MPNLNIKTTHKPIKTYYTELEKYAQLGEENEGTVRAAFQNLLQHYCGQSNLTLLCEKSHYTPERRRIIPDGEVVDDFGLPHGYWEAKDTQDDLHIEADKKFATGYPSKNIVVQSPTHALLYQHGQLQLDLDITNPRNLVHVREIENVVDALTERTLNRSEFLRPLNPFYVAIEQTASTITDFSQKQGFLNTVYEQFFQGFSVKVAKTMRHCDRISPTKYSVQF